MNDFCPTMTLNVLIQENGIIRTCDGHFIGRLTNKVDFYSETLCRTPELSDAPDVPEEEEIPTIGLEKAVENVINLHCGENDSNTPDFILAQYLMGCLQAYNTAVQQRETWYGRDARPSCTAD